jgi:hypothetical protein
VGSDLAAAKRRSTTRLAAAHLHLRRIARKSAMRLQQADVAVGLGSSSSSSGSELLPQPQQHFWLAHG